MMTDEQKSQIYRWWEGFKKGKKLQAKGDK